MRPNKLKQEIQAILQESEQSWSGFVNEGEVVDRLLSLMTAPEPFKITPDPINTCKDLERAPSLDFEDAVSDSVTTSAATCELCGRLTFNYDLERDGDEGEWELYLKGSEQDPDKFILVDYSIPLGRVGGFQVVLGCPCNKLRLYEEFIWDHTGEIALYLDKRLKKAQKNVEKLKQRVVIIKQLEE